MYGIATPSGTLSFLLPSIRILVGLEIFPWNWHRKDFHVVSQPVHYDEMKGIDKLLLRHQAEFLPGHHFTFEFLDSLQQSLSSYKIVYVNAIM